MSMLPPMMPVIPTDAGTPSQSTNKGSQSTSRGLQSTNKGSQSSTTSSQGSTPKHGDHADFAKVLDKASSRQDDNAKTSTDSSKHSSKSDKSNNSSHSKSIKSASDKSSDDATAVKTDEPADQPVVDNDTDTADATTPVADAQPDDALAAAAQAAAAAVVSESLALPITPTITAAPVAAEAVVTAPIITAIAAPAAVAAPSPIDAAVTPGSGTPIDVATGDPMVVMAPDAGDGSTPIIDPKLAATTDPNTAAPAPTAPTTDTNTDAAATPLPDTADILDNLAKQVATTGVADLVQPDAKTTATGIDPTAAKSALDLLGATPATTQSTTAAATTTKVANTPIPLEPYKQVAAIVQPLRQAPDGDYTMTLRLHPAQLGHVDVAVTLQNGQISMQLSSDNAASCQLLRDSMNQLRSDLESSGLSTGSLDVGTQDSQQQAQQNNNSSRSSRASLGDVTDLDSDNFFARLAMTNAQQSATDGPLDVRI